MVQQKQVATGRNSGIVNAHNPAMPEKMDNYARREIPVIQDELEEIRWELWQQAQSLRAAQIAHRWAEG